MANIIRAVADVPRRVIDGQLYDARLEAGRIVASAREAAAELMRAAEAEAVRLQASVRSAAQEQGLEDARETLVWAAAERDRLLAAAEPELVRLAVGIAAAVLGRAAEQGAGVALEQARKAVAEARERTCVALRVHPADLEVVRASEAELGRLAPRCAGLAWVADAGVGRGGVVVETETGSIDARLESQLAVVARLLARSR